MAWDWRDGACAIDVSAVGDGGCCGCAEVTGGVLRTDECGKSVAVRYLVSMGRKREEGWTLKR